MDCAIFGPWTDATFGFNILRAAESDVSDLKMSAGNNLQREAWC